MAAMMYMQTWCPRPACQTLPSATPPLEIAEAPVWPPAMFFVISWPGGTETERCPHATNLESAIRLFKKRLQVVPFAERDVATARFDAQVRKAGGGCRRIPLASWSASQSLAVFFRAARAAWQRLPKEHDDDAST